MRVHGDLIIRRRDNIEKQKSYVDYLDALTEDFQDICGYCGKKQHTFSEKFQIDHFAPQRFKEKIADYNNLVLACPKCNRHKSDKWPTEDSNISVLNNEGFIDPASEEFDKHFHRNSNGDIIPDTEIGEYMYRVFRFDIRPIATIYKVNKLKEYQEKYEKILMADSNQERVKNYIEINQMLREVLDDLIYNQKE